MQGNSQPVIMSLSLLEKRNHFKQTDVIPAMSLGPERIMGIFAEVKTLDPLKNKLQEWLSRVGLELNPFEYIDAGRDPLIPFYLIDHNEFDKVSGDQPSFVFAPAGGGKTAFRVRLARECRAGKNGRRIFPIVFKPTGPADSDDDQEKSAKCQRTDLLRYAAQELLLHLAYYPYVLDEMDPALRRDFLQVMSWDLNFPIAYYLSQMRKTGNLDPIINAFDPTARSLPNPPGRDDILYLYNKLADYSPKKTKPDDETRLDILFDLILNKLKYKAIYILVDGVDAFLETTNTPKRALSAISWLLDNTLPWTENRIFVKCFLPNETLPIVMGTSAFHPLTSKSKIIMIKWDADALSEVIRQRLQEASGGKFDSLAAVSDRALRASGDSPEEILITELRRHKKSSPRSLIRAINWLFINHVRDPRVREKLTPQDLEAVREWIRREYSARG